MFTVELQNKSKLISDAMLDTTVVDIFFPSKRGYLGPLHYVMHTTILLNIKAPNHGVPKGLHQNTPGFM